MAMVGLVAGLSLSSYSGNRRLPQELCFTPAQGRSMFPTTARPPAKQSERDQQMPLGAHPTYDDVLDTAVEYTFPCSDPIAVDSCCASRAAAAEAPVGADKV
jgi:hypothetical protein